MFTFPSVRTGILVLALTGIVYPVAGNEVTTSRRFGWLGPETVDASKTGVLKGVVTNASGIFRSYLPPSPGDMVAFDFNHTKQMTLTLQHFKLNMQVAKVFWGPDGELVAIRLVAEYGSRRIMGEISGFRTAALGHKYARAELYMTTPDGWIDSRVEVQVIGFAAEQMPTKR